MGARATKTQEQETKVVVTFAEMLKRDNKSIRDERAIRVSSEAKMDFIELVNSTRRELFGFENQLDAMSDLSTSNTTTTANRIGEFTFNSVEFVKRRANLRLQRALTTQKLELLMEDAAFYGLDEKSI